MNSTSTMGVVLIMISLLMIIPEVSSSAVGPAPTTKVDCSNLVLQMVDCLSFVSANSSTVTKPAGSCCAGLKNVMKASPDCICEAFANSTQLGVSLNITKAMTLPTICHVASPLDNCKVSHGNIAPVTSPKAASDKPTPAEEPTKAAPTASSTKNSGSILTAASTGIVLVLAIALISVA